ncbi:helix-turn-helix transcriptional regulator [Chitinophaga sp. 30R24]|uniref:helix-turn-helix transcriptional regulator n=1 Tax=Chitinophaga sp. 30R24 TaxID=3248838 RepID=UPI003B8FCCA3
MSVQHLGYIIKSRRDFLKLTQADLSEMSGVNMRTIHLIENGEGNPSLLTLEKLLTVLGMEISVQLKTID